VAVEGGTCGCVGFYYVDNRNLHFSEIEDAVRIDLPDSCDIETLVSCFTETSDAIFMPTNPTKQISQEPFCSIRLAEDHQLFLRNSVLVVPDFFTKEECHIFMDAADRSASVGSAAGKFYSNQPGLNRYPVRKLDLEAQMLSDSVLKDRLLPLLQRSSFCEELFGTSQLKDLKAFFSPGEPAVNRYITGGAIAPHIDREQLTLNVLLSEPGAFQGGGTAFWPQIDGSSPTEVDDEVVVLRPLQGTAIMFNGQVTHAGRAVSAGIRHAYVASFSLVSLE